MQPKLTIVTYEYEAYFSINILVNALAKASNIFEISCDTFEWRTFQDQSYAIVPSFRNILAFSVPYPLLIF